MKLKQNFDRLRYFRKRMREKMFFVTVYCNLWLSVSSEWVTEMESKYFNARCSLDTFRTMD